jgi:hypothetical protein
MPTGLEPVQASGFGGGATTAASFANPAGLGLAAFQVWSGFQQAGMIRDQAALQNRINEMNAGYIEYDAWEAEQFGFSQASRYQTVVDEMEAAQQVGFAAQDIDFTSGTAAALIAESSLNGYLNSLEIKEAGARKAYGLKIQASNVRLGSDMGSLQAGVDAGAAVRSGIIGAGVTGYSAFG